MKPSDNMNEKHIPINANEEHKPSSTKEEHESNNAQKKNKNTTQTKSMGSRKVHMKNMDQTKA
jgi:hypothetical protein